MYKNIGGSFKEPTLKQIEPRALELELYRSHRKVYCEDLFAKRGKLSSIMQKIHLAYNI